MVCRRWCVGAAAVLVAAGLGSFAQGALPTTADLKAQASKLDSAHGPDAMAIKEGLLTTARGIRDIIDRNNFAREVTAAFGPALSSSNADARLNAAILIAELGTPSTDTTLKNMLTSQDAFVRYWGAKGLGGIAEIELKFSPEGIIAALENAAKNEKSGVVLQELIRSLAKYGSTAGILTGLEAVAAQIQTTMPDVGMLDAATAGLSAIGGKIAASPAPEKLRAASVAAQLASFTAQQYRLNAKIIKEAGTEVPKAFVDSVNALVDSALKIMGESAGKTFTLRARGTPDELWINLNDITGTTVDGNRPGDLQKALPGVPIPGATKVGS
jgi:hypothetical protein